MITTARVEALDERSVRLTCARSLGCGPCSTGRGCAIRLLGRSRDGSLELPLQSFDSTPEPGDQVRISVGESSLLRSVAWMFLPPSLGMLLGAFLGHGVGGDGIVLASAGAGLCAGFLLARRRAPVPTILIERQSVHARQPV